jgi:hypothetical protein
VSRRGIGTARAIQLGLAFLGAIAIAFLVTRLIMTLASR